MRQALVPRWLNDCLSPSSRTASPRKIRYSHLDHTSIQEEKEQALRDYKVTIEYKHLKAHAPGGVYLVPAYDSLRFFYGVIFVRRGKRKAKESCIYLTDFHQY